MTLMSIPDTFLEDFILSTLDLDKSIRWVGIASSDGNLLLVKRRKDLVPLMTYQENKDYTASAISRHKSRIQFETKIGKLLYAIGKYEKLTRVMVPVTDYYYLLITLDIEESNFDSILSEKVIPFINVKRDSFNAKNSG